MPSCFRVVGHAARDLDSAAGGLCMKLRARPESPALKPCTSAWPSAATFLKAGALGFGPVLSGRQVRQNPRTAWSAGFNQQKPEVSFENGPRST